MLGQAYMSPMYNEIKNKTKLSEYVDSDKDVYGVHFQADGSIETLGNTNAFKIFGVLKDVLIKFINEVKSKYFLFEAMQDRIKLYDKFVILAKMYNYKEIYTDKGVYGAKIYLLE